MDLKDTIEEIIRDLENVIGIKFTDEYKVHLTKKMHELIVHYVNEKVANTFKTVMDLAMDAIDKATLKPPKED